MRDVMKRIEQLEARAMPREQIRIIHQIIEAKDGRALPWNPTRAEGAGGETIDRAEGESAEAFEARAVAHFPTGRLIIGGDRCEGSPGCGVV